MTEWQPIDMAPKDGTEIQVRIPGHGSDNVVAWQTGFMDEDEKECGCWVFTRDQEPPESWTDGVCWQSNENEEESVCPTEWKPLETA